MENPTVPNSWNVNSDLRKIVFKVSFNFCVLQKFFESRTNPILEYARTTIHHVILALSISLHEGPPINVRDRKIWIFNTTLSMVTRTEFPNIRWLFQEN